MPEANIFSFDVYCPHGYALREKALVYPGGTIRLPDDDCVVAVPPEPRRNRIIYRGRGA